MAAGMRPGAYWGTWHGTTGLLCLSVSSGREEFLPAKRGGVWACLACLVNLWYEREFLSCVLFGE